MTVGRMALLGELRKDGSLSTLELRGAPLRLATRYVDGAEKPNSRQHSVKSGSWTCTVNQLLNTDVFRKSCLVLA